MASLDEVGPTLPSIARRAITDFLSGEGMASFEPGGPASPVFVTLRGPGGALRGCIGSVSPSRRDVVSETARSAVLAATRDPRFDPVSASEVSRLSIEVSVLEPEEPIETMAELDPSRYGVVVRDGSGRQGLLLPDIDGVNDAGVQVDVARRKAGIQTGVPLRLSRFLVHKWMDQAAQGA
ncbi:MAG TPA: AmmeMemoRadiSam system protein A [Polyangiaceae bacterium]|jgi:AmmeMemoRadiSam system protein A|nr:AmmeMemoRadiSam system protein A [Polyangiaceae bacterium]